MSNRYLKALGRRLRLERLEDRRVLATLWVDPSVAPTPTILSSISAAVAAAHSGDTIKVVGGTYQEQVDVTKSLTLIGGQVRVAGQSGASIIAPSDPVTSMYGFKLDANKVKVKNFTIQNEMMDAIQTNGAFAGFNILHNIFFNDAVGIALSTSSASTAAATTISGNQFTSNGAGPTPMESILSHGGLANVTIAGNTCAQSNVVAAIEVDGAIRSMNVRIVNNRISLGQGILVANLSMAKIDGNQIRFLHGGDPAHGPIAIRLAGAVSDSEVAGNTLVDAGDNETSYGVVLDEALVGSPDTGNKISGNTIQGVLSSANTPTGFVTGIYISSASRNTVSANFVAFARDDGIFLTQSESNTVSSNSVTENDVGIHVIDSDNNTLLKNSANNNKTHGIIVGGNANILKGNVTNLNGQFGIRLISGGRNMLMGNTANDNLRTGVGLDSAASMNTLSENTASSNGYNGFELSASTANSFSGNRANGNGSQGFFVSSGSDNNTFTKNIVKRNGAGIDVEANGCTISANTVSANGFVGIEVRGDSNVVKGNMVTATFGFGIYVGGHMVTVSSNIVKNNQGDGIRLVQLLSSTLSGNVVMDDDGDGIDATSSSSSNTISGNTAMGNGLTVGGFDLFDGSIGFLTAGTANTWLNNKAQTRSPSGLL